MMRKLYRIFLIIVTIFTIASPALARPQLSSPIDCAVPQRCMIQHYVDLQAGSGATDLACQGLSYHNHQGTDFRVPDLSAMRAGVRVLAAADGIVSWVSDGTPNGDLSGRSAHAAKANGTECGNGVQISHADGWKTRYCHLSPNISVREGDHIRRGAFLGYVGMSGFTTWPHLHFGVVSPDGFATDPFTGRSMGSHCGQSGRSMWLPQTGLRYEPILVQSIGFLGSNQAVSRQVIDHDQAISVTKHADALIFYVQYIGLRTGDVLTLELTGPYGFQRKTQRAELTRNRILTMRYTGRLNQGQGFPAGRYRGIARILRNGRVISQTIRHLQLN